MSGFAERPSLFPYEARINSAMVVTGAKVKNASLTGADIDYWKLGTVPSAVFAAWTDELLPAVAVFCPRVS
jgi:hypothetical protein